MFVRSGAIGLLFVAQMGLAQTPDTERVAAGQRLFETNCTACHGQNAKGGRGPNLTGRLRHGSLESEMADNITAGIAGTQMPAFPMPAENARAIVAYLRSLSAGGPDLPIAGNTANGQQVFFGAGKCSSCHMYQGHGGRLGPDLSRIGEARTARQLQAAIAQPHREQMHGFESVEIRLRDGSQIRGVLKNQDTFSVQVMDQGEKLHMLAKKDAASVRLTGKSLMPEGLEKVLKQQDVADLIAFLRSPTPTKPANK